MKASSLLSFACTFILAPLAAAQWKWDDDPVPDLGFDLDAARVIAVTSLESDGKGSLRQALWAEGPRIIVFEVGGVIDLGGRALSVGNPQVVVAGQTAPGPGITLIRGGMSVSASQVLVQHLCIRPGDDGRAKKSGWAPDGFTTSKAVRDVFVDHCSLTWSVDENLSASGYGAPEGEFAARIAFRDCIVAEGLNDSTHEKGPHSKGTLILDGTREVAIVRCLYAANVERNPLFKCDTSGVVVNCLIAGPGQRSIHGSTPEPGSVQAPPSVAAVGNAVLFAPHTKKISAIIEGGTNWYAADNFGKTADGQPVPLIRNGEIAAGERPVWPEGLEPMPSAEVIAWISAHAGARPTLRDPIDQRIVTEALEARNRIIDSQEEVGGYPQRDAAQRPLEVPAEGRRDWLRKLAREVGDVLPGDVIALKYPPGGEYTGHIMVVAEAPKKTEPKKFIIPDTEQWLVTVVDQSKSGHGPNDTRRTPDGEFRGGLGKGVFRVYASPDGTITGYSWSTFSVSEYYSKVERDITIGRPDPAFEP